MVDTLAEVERLSLEEREEQGFYQESLNWITTAFRENLKDLLPQKGLDRDINLADCSREFARRLNLLVRDGKNNDKKFSSQLKDAIIGRDRDSVVNCFGQDEYNREKIVENIVGPISCLTLLDIIKRSRPDLRKKIKFSEVVVEGRQDVEDKVDAIIKFGDKNYQGKEIVRLVQLKTERVCVANIERIDPDNLKGDYLAGKVSRKDAISLLNAADRLARHDKVEVRAFAIRVPSFDTKVVDNVYGLIEKDNGLVQVFDEEAVDTGFYPRE